MARKYEVKTPKNQRPLIKDEYTSEVKRKMGIGILPFIFGAFGLVYGMGQAMPTQGIRIGVLAFSALIFLSGVIILLKGAMDLSSYSKAYWEKEDEKKYGKVEEKPREKITWKQAKDEYKAEAKAAANEASRLAAEQLAKANAPAEKK